MNRLAIVLLLLATPALAQTTPAVKEPVCEPIGRTSKGDLVYSMECRNIPGLAAGIAGYNPAPVDKDVAAPPTPAPPGGK
jgi:hypothetical protein